MPWADPSCYKTATDPLAKYSTRYVKHLGPDSCRSGPGIGCGRVGVEADRVDAVLYYGERRGWQRLEVDGDCTRGRVPRRRETRHGQTGGSGTDAGPAEAARSDRDVIRRLHYRNRTEHACVDWIRCFILFDGKRHPAEMGAPEVEAFLTHLAVQGKVAASTQNQATQRDRVLLRAGTETGTRLAGRA